MSRHYFAHRRAYYPRIWPMYLAALLIVEPLVTLMHPGVLGACAIAVVTGVSIGRGRFWLWRRRHPIIEVDEYLDDLRRAASWN